MNGHTLSMVNKTKVCVILVTMSGYGTHLRRPTQLEREPIRTEILLEDLQGILVGFFILYKYYIYTNVRDKMVRAVLRV